MAFLKKYPIFTALLVVLLLIFAAQIYLFSTLSTRADAARIAADRSARNLESYLQMSPAPTAANLELAENNVKELGRELRQRIQTVRGQIDSAVGQDVPASASDLLFEIQSFVDRYNALARAPGDDIDPIQLPANFGFSFRNLIDGGVPPEDAQIPGLWKQKEIIQYLMDSLYASGPISITAVERELLVQPSPGQEDTRPRRTQPTERSGRPTARTTPQGIFAINPLISARVPGAVETMAFRIQFTGYTSALRDFLVQLSSFELPIVVRSVEVAPAPATATRRDDDVFGGIFGTQRPQPEAAGVEDRARRPVVVDNVSRFTIVVEFIQVVLDDTNGTEGFDAVQATEVFDL